MLRTGDCLANDTQLVRLFFAQHTSLCALLTFTLPNPSFDGMFAGEKILFGDASRAFSAFEGREFIVSAMEMNHGNRPRRVALLGPHGPCHRRDGGEALGEL